MNGENFAKICGQQESIRIWRRSYSWLLWTKKKEKWTLGCNSNGVMELATSDLERKTEKLKWPSRLRSLEHGGEMGYWCHLTQKLQGWKRLRMKIALWLFFDSEGLTWGLNVDIDWPVIKLKNWLYKKKSLKWDSQGKCVREDVVKWGRLRVNFGEI